VIKLLTVAAATLGQPALADAVNNEQQLARGKAAYAEHCAECHHLTLRGTGHGSEPSGSAFIAKWGTRSVADLIGYSSNLMPAGAPKSLPPAQYVDNTAHVLQVNGGNVGPGELQADDSTEIGLAVHGEAWKDIKAGLAENAGPTQWQSWQAAASIAGEAERSHGFANKEVADFVPVTDKLLRDPPDADWLNWRRTADGQAHSPLGQVTRRNVGELKLAWALTMPEGSNQARRWFTTA